MPHHKQQYVHRDQREYLREYRKKISVRKGLIPYIHGKQHFLTESEQLLLVKKILCWKNPLTQPVIADLPKLV
jgi:hypothetical protein